MAVFAGAGPALWTAVALVVSIGTNRLTGVVGDTSLTLLGVLTFGSMVLAAVSAVLLFLGFGWLPAGAVLVLFVGYFAARETDGSKTRRAMTRLCENLDGFLAAREAGAITEDQLRARAFSALDDNLSDLVRAIPAYYEPLIEAAGMPSSRYQRLLRLLSDYLADSEKYTFRESELRQAVRERL